MSYLDSRFAELHAELEQGKLDSKAKAKAAELALKAPAKEQKVDPTSRDWQTVPVGDDFLKDPDSPMINGEETRLSGPVGFSPDAPEIEGAERYEKDPRDLEQHQRNFENKFGFTPNEEELNLWERTQRADSQEFLTRDTPEGENPTAEIRYTGRESHGRPVIEARNRAGESLGEYQSESERNVAYDSPYNRAQQHEDIVSGKYGSEIAGDYSRGPGEILQDTASAVGQAALVSTGRLIGEVGKITGAMPDSWVEGIHEGTNAVDEWFDGLKGLSLDKQREKYESWQAIREKDRPARIAKLVEGGMSQTKAETYDMVDDAWNTLRALSKNPTVALDSVASVAGQLLPNVVGGAAVGKVATKVMTKMAKGKALTAAEKATVQKIQGATGITQGAMTEGAHASYDLRNNILDTDFDTLAENSEVYRQNLETTNGDKEKARALTADSEATKTFLLNSTVMGASSAVLAKAGLSMESAAGKGFRGLAPKLAPLEGGAKAGLARTAGATGKSAVGNVLEEGGVQEPLNQAIENYFAQRNIDPEQSLLQGVGRAAAEGAVGGAGSGGVMGGASQAVTEGARGVRGRPGTPIADAIDAGITAAGETHGLPDIAVSKLRSITDIESGWGANMRGKAIGTEISGDMTHAGDRAMGPFQFMTKTAQGYGLKDRMDPTQSADAAARLLKDNYNTIKKAMPGLSEEELWHKAALAHHSGAGNVIKGKLGKWGKDYDQKLRKRGGSYFKGKATPTGTGSQAPGITATPADHAQDERERAVAAQSKTEASTQKGKAAEPVKEITTEQALKDFDALFGKYEDKRNFTVDEVNQLSDLRGKIQSDLVTEFKKTKDPAIAAQIKDIASRTKEAQTTSIQSAAASSMATLRSPDTEAALSGKGTPEQRQATKDAISTVKKSARAGGMDNVDISDLPEPIQAIINGAKAEGIAEQDVFGEKFGAGVGSTGPGVQNHNNKINQAIGANNAPAAQEALSNFQNFTNSQRAKANEWEKAADIASQLQPGEKSTYKAPPNMSGAPKRNLENVATLRGTAETYGKEAAAMEQMAAGHQASIEQMAPAPETTEEATPAPKEAAPKPKEKAAKKPEKAPETKPEPKVKKAEKAPAKPVKTGKKPAAELSVAEAQEELDALRQNAAEYGDYMTDEEYNRDLARAKELNARIKQGETGPTADEVLDQQEAELKAKTKTANEKVTAAPAETKVEKPTPEPKPKSEFTEQQPTPTEPVARSLSEVTIELDGKPMNAAVERDAISSLTEQLKMIKSICQ